MSFVGHVRYCSKCGKEVIVPGREEDSTLKGKKVVCPKCQGVAQPNIRKPGCN